MFVMGSLNEILKSFDLPVVFPRSTPADGRAPGGSRVSREAEDHGYSPDICGYVKADVAVQLRGGGIPWVGSPNPPSRCSPTPATPTSSGPRSGSGCTRCPMFTMDIPGTRQGGRDPDLGGDPDFEDDRRYVDAQMRGSIALCEQVTGRKFDIDKFRETCSAMPTR